MSVRVRAFLPRKGIDLFQQQGIADTVTIMHHAADEEILPRGKGREECIEKLRSEWVVGKPISRAGIGDVESYRPGLYGVLLWRRSLLCRRQHVHDPPPPDGCLAIRMLTFIIWPERFPQAIPFSRDAY